MLTFVYIIVSSITRTIYLLRNVATMINPSSCLYAASGLVSFLFTVFSARLRGQNDNKHRSYSYNKSQRDALLLNFIW
jgi:hypothetical protein